MAEIDTLRGEIDDITIQMIKLLKKRTSVSRQIGTIKGSSGKNVLDEEREEQLRTLVLKACSEIELDDSMGTRLLNFLLNESVKCSLIPFRKVVTWPYLQRQKRWKKMAQRLSTWK